MNEKLDASEDEETSEHEDHPVEHLKQSGARKDESGAHDERPEDPPEKNAMLQRCRDREIREQNKKDEEIVDRESLLDQVAREKLEGALGAKPMVHARVEEQG